MSALHQWTMLSLCAEASAAEAGHPDHSTLTGTHAIWRQKGLTCAHLISDILWQLYREWGNDHYPVMAIQPMAPTLFALLEDLAQEESRVAFIRLFESVQTAAKRFIVCRGVIQVLQEQAATLGVQLPEEVLRSIRGEKQDHSAEHKMRTKPIIVDYLLGKWDDLKLE